MPALRMCKILQLTHPPPFCRDFPLCHPLWFSNPPSLPDNNCTVPYWTWAKLFAGLFVCFLDDLKIPLNWKIYVLLLSYKYVCLLALLNNKEFFSPCCDSVVYQRKTWLGEVITFNRITEPLVELQITQPGLGGDGGSWVGEWVRTITMCFAKVLSKKPNFHKVQDGFQIQLTGFSWTLIRS